jgi:hypothetical protein
VQVNTTQPSSAFQLAQDTQKVAQAHFKCKLGLIINARHRGENRPKTKHLYKVIKKSLYSMKNKLLFVFYLFIINVGNDLLWFLNASELFSA